MRFSIRTMLLFTTAVAVVCASLVYANAILGDLYYTLGLLTIGFSILAAIYCSGPDRAFWVGFVVLFAGYFCHTVWPVEVRGMWTFMSGFGTFGGFGPKLFTTEILRRLCEQVHGISMSQQLGPVPTPAGFQSDIDIYMSFLTIGHTAIAMLLGVIGGLIARRFALQATKEKNESDNNNAK